MNDPADLPGFLADWLAGDDPDWLDNPDAEVIPPAGQEEANRLLRRLARVERAECEVLDLYATERDRLDAWKQARLAVLEGQHNRLTEALTAWHAAVLRDDPKAKTISLPSGTLRARKQQAKWHVDADTFREWAQQNAPHLLRPAEPDRNAIKAAFSPVWAEGVGPAVTGAGEVVPGVEVEQRGIGYSVDPAVAP